MKTPRPAKDLPIAGSLRRWDAALSARLAAADGSWLRARAARVAHWGDGPLVFLGLVLVYGLGGFLNAEGLRQAALVALAGSLSAAVVVTAIKYTIRRQRPRDPAGFVTIRYDKYSFPSGHSARMAALSVAAILFHPLAGGGFGLLALAVAAARVVIGIHYVADVVAGLVIGAAVTGLVWMALG
ncbi:MAG: phosphatase PAP2 family protein [Anaerolineae bacterium]